MGWIAGWNKRIKLTISGSCVEGGLSNFPVMIHLDSTCSGIFNELGSNSKRISIVTSDQQQCYIEVERWDESINNAWLWVNIPTLTSGIDSDLYLYYDNLRPDNSAYVGTVGETSAQNVWDDNFVGVWHMNQDPSGGAGCILNSTSFSGLDGTPAGSMVSEDLVDGKIGKAIDFDGDGDYIDTGYLMSYSTVTAEAILKQTAYQTCGVCSSLDSGSDYFHPFIRDDGTIDGVFGPSGNIVGLTNDGDTLVSGTWASVAWKIDSTDISRYKDGQQTGTIDGKTFGTVDLDRSLFIGGRHATVSDSFFGGLIDELRISSINRSDSWIKATHYSNFDQLVGYGVEEVVSSGFLPGWNNRLKLTIQNDYVDNTLTDFPVMIKLSNSSGFNSYDNRGVFYELEADVNRKKIAITDSTGTLQCFVEIEKFSCAETQAVLWTKLPVIYADVGTHFYLYYDKTQADNISFVGDVNSIQAQNVWDSNFVGVWHMNQNPTGGSGCIKDSTSNTNHGTPGGSMASGDLVDGKIGKALDFDGTNDIINCTGATLGQSTGLTLEAITKVPVALASTKYLVVNQQSGDTTTANILYLSYSSPNLYLSCYIASSDVARVSAYQVDVDRDTFINVTGVYKGDQVAPDVYKNGIDVTSSGIDGTGIDITNDTGKICIGGRSYDNNRNFNGITDEVRISNTARSAPWVKATYYSNWDDLIIYEIEDISANWLADWSKRIKLTIDQTKIDSSLTDFPILITLTSGVQSDFFSELDYGSVDDGFTGSNGDSLNSDLWYKNTSLVSGTIDIQSNKARLTYVSSEEDINFLETSYYMLTGDFDVQVDFDLLTDLETNAWWVGLRFDVQDSSGYWFFVCRGYDGSTKHFRFRYNGNDGNTNVDESSTLTSSKLRIVRSGSNISAYYWDGSWNQIGVSNAWGSADVFVSMFCYKNFIGSELQADFDNFTVTSGTVIWPQNTHPNRKKIAATTNDGTTQCPVEIEQFDTTSGTVNLWTKPPLISYSSDTDIYLYYDCSKNDNTTYVGDVGSTPAQSVWDENFVGVWHMNQDPTGGIGAIKDSTSNVNHGTASGTMTSDDLVDGKIGKALDFDGSDDYIEFFDITETATLTTEFLMYSDVTQVHSPLGDTETTNTYAAVEFFDNDGSFWSRMRIDGANETMSGGIVLSSTWYHVCMYYDGAACELLVDGVSIQKITGLNGSIYDSPSNLIVGRRGDEDGGAQNYWYFDGKIGEVRISNTARSVSWVKATYYSNWNTLLTYSSVQTYTLPPDYYYHGYVKEKGVYVARKVYLYRRDTGVFIDSCMSNSDTGYYLLETSVSGEHFIVALDDDAGDDYNALVQDRVYPNGM